MSAAAQRSVKEGSLEPQKRAQIRHFRSLARLVLTFSAQRFTRVQGANDMVKNMARFEAVAFAFGFIASGLLTLVSLPLA